MGDPGNARPADVPAKHKVYLYNKWLPPPVAEQLDQEEARFHNLAVRLREIWQPGNIQTALKTLKIVEVLNSFYGSKSTVALEDVESIVELGLEVVLDDCVDSSIRTKWIAILTKFASRYKKKLKVTIAWRRLYDILWCTSFNRQQFYEGDGITSEHSRLLVSFVKRYRRFFPPGSATEIWNKFRPDFDDLNRICCLEAAGFVSLFLPTSSTSETYVLTSEWIQECLGLWLAIPSCYFWSLQWNSLITRCLKSMKISWEPFMSTFFSHYLNSFRVPVARSASQPPFDWISYRISYTFNDGSTSQLAARSIVFLLAPEGSAQEHFEKLVDLLEPYYHPSNGGSWTDSLKNFLHHLVCYFFKRLVKERKLKNGSQVLGGPERAAFVKTVLRLAERGQHSKDHGLAKACSRALAQLSYVEPTLALPISISSFKTAVTSITATHQLESALRTLALSCRPIFLLLEAADSGDVARVACDTLKDAMFSTLPGLDANDVPKTLSTMQFYCSVLSNVRSIGGEHVAFFVDWPVWVDQFLDKLFGLLHGLDPGLCSDEYSSDSLTTLGSYYLPMLGLFFGRLTQELLKQALERVQHFVAGPPWDPESNVPPVLPVLPGAVAEVGNLCYAAIEGDPHTGANTIVGPIIRKLVSMLEDAPSTGFADDEDNIKRFKQQQDEFSLNLEITASYNLRIVGMSLSGQGALNLSSDCKQELKKVITLSFNAPSTKVNEAAQSLLRQLVEGLISYYPVDSFKSEQWIGIKQADELCLDPPKWHLSSPDEITFVNELIDCHLEGPLSVLSKLSTEDKSDSPPVQKDFLQVTLLRLEGVLHGLASCIPDFPSATTDNFIFASSGAQVGSPNLRNRIAEVLHAACGYLLKKKGDEFLILNLLVSVMDATVNRSTEYGMLNYHRHRWRAQVTNFTEPNINFITGSTICHNKRPLWLVYGRVEVQNMLRVAEVDPSASPAAAVELLANDLLKLSLHRYKKVRSYASAVLIWMFFSRYSVLVPRLLPSITVKLNEPKSSSEETTDKSEIEASALGACYLLRSPALLRILMEDWTCVSTFLSSILASAHHDSSKAQNAINKVFKSTNFYFSVKAFEKTAYHDLITHIKTIVDNDSVHWRYNLMAQGLLLFLALSPNPCSVQENLEVNRSLCGHFLKNLTSEHPALRPLSVIAALLLMGAEDDKTQEYETGYVDGVKNAVQDLLDTKFGLKMIENSAVDHHYSDEDGLDISKTLLDSGLTSYMPMYMEDWPATRSWNSKFNGVAFSRSFAKLVHELTRRHGETVLEVLKQPLIDASKETDDRGKQCTAAEIIAGLVRSDSPCVVLAWEEWLHVVLEDALKATTLDSAPEWMACVRFAVGADKKNGKVPSLSCKVLRCVTGLLSSSESSTRTAKSFSFTSAVLLELNLDGLHQAQADVAFHITLLQQTMTYRSHLAPQVRKAAGGILGILLANLRYLLKPEDMMSGDRQNLDMCIKQLIDGARDASLIIQKNDRQLANGKLAPEVHDGHDVDNKRHQAIKEMETVLHFLIASMRTARFYILADIAIELLHPLLLLLNTSEKDLASLASEAIRIFKWQQFQPSSVPKVVLTILDAANGENWRVRMSALSFLQPFVYRHFFVMDDVRDWELLWNKVVELLCDPRLEVRELASTTAAGLMKGADYSIVNKFREQALAASQSICPRGTRFPGLGDNSSQYVHEVVLRLASCILSVPYDIPSWLPEMVTTLTYFDRFQWPIKATVARTIGEFRRTHSDAWDVQKIKFSEEQLELLLNCGTASYFT